MDQLSIQILKALHKSYQKLTGNKKGYILNYDSDPDSVAKTISNALLSDKPCMIARFGANELACLINYIGVKTKKKSIISYIKGKSLEWWWNSEIIHNMHIGAGFFPPQISKIEQFCELMITDIPLVDILGSWLSNEKHFENELKMTHKVNLELLNPYFSKNPWTHAIEGKKVLVVHPFVETIEQQYLKRKDLFKDNLLPQFELKTIKSVQSIAGTKTKYKDWFEALDFMKNQIDEIDYDICLIGCGAYGFPLAAHVKRSGKKGFHMGGSLQLLFGIKGKRWENEKYNETYNYASLMNKYWVKPKEEEKPVDADVVENACYW